jgi:hypothetical protein
MRAGIHALLFGRATVFDDQPEIDRLEVMSINEFESVMMAIVSVAGPAAGSRPELCQLWSGVLRAKQFNGEPRPVWMFLMA